jgi:hypothetical protein
MDTITRLKHVKMSIPQEFVLDTTMMNSYASPEPKFKLSHTNLAAFLDSSSQLESFGLHFGDCSETAAGEMTEGGKVLLSLGKLEQLQAIRTTCLVLDRANILTAILANKGDSLKVLDLESLTLGKDSHGGDPWPREMTTEVVAAIEGLKKLVALRISRSPLCDFDLERLLSGKSDLRCLELSGRFGDNYEGFGNLTDTGVATIVRCCPNLQSLNLSYQRRITATGVDTVLHGCPHLRELDVSAVRVHAQDLPNLLSLAPKLLVFSWQHEHFPGPPGSVIAGMKEAVLATGGRTLICETFTGLVEVPSPPAACVRDAACSKRLVDEAQERGEDPTIHNEWDFLM